MSSSIFIARLLGPVFLVVGIALLLKRRMFHEILQELIRSQVLLYLAGFLGLLAGLALVLTHNVWVLDWMLIITLIGWMTLARAIVTIFAPQRLVAMASTLLNHREYFSGAAVVNLSFGLVLSYFRYLA